MTNRRLVPYWFIAPAMIALAVVILVPLIYSVRMGFTSWNLVRFNSPAFVGLENYERLLADTRFWASIVRTLVFAISSVALQFLVGFGMALILADLKLGRRLINTFVLVPMMIPSVVTAVIWSLILEPQFGLLNALLRLTSLGGGTAWLASPDTALASIVVVEAWRGVPFVALILTAGIVSLPREPFESATIDGASAPQILRFLTIPLLKPLILLVLALRLMDALRAFDTFYILTKGGPADATAIASIFLYRTSFESYQLGYASVLGQIILAVVILVSLAVFILPNRRPRPALD